MADMKNYNSSQVQMVLAGIPITKGLAKGTFLRIEYNSDAYTYRPHTDGGGTRSATNDKSARITLILSQDSEVNDLLSALHNSDTASGGVAGVGPIMIKDMNGRSLYTAMASWIVRRPNAEFGDESGTREWIFETHELNAFDGGS